MHQRDTPGGASTGGNDMPVPPDCFGKATSTPPVWTEEGTLHRGTLFLQGPEIVGDVPKASPCYTVAPAKNARSIQAIFSCCSISPVRKSFVPMS